MGNGQIGYDISPFEALDEVGMNYPQDKELQEVVSGTKEYIQHLQKNQKEMV